MATSVGFTGYIPDVDDSRDHQISISDLNLDTGPSPAAFNIYTDKSFKAHIYDQGNVGSCVCNAFATAYSIALQRQNTHAYFTPSRLFLYYLARLSQDPSAPATQRSTWFESMASQPPTQDMPPDCGSRNRDVLRALSALGACNEAPTLWTNKYGASGQWPYIDVSYSPNQEPWQVTLSAGAVNGEFPPGALCRQAPDALCFANAVKHRTLRYAHPQPWDDVMCWKKLLANGYPVVFAFELFYGFGNLDARGVAPTPGPGDAYDTGHVVVAVGWDDGMGKEGCFRVQNSWGEGWGEGGFFWMPFEWLGMDRPDRPGWRLLQGDSSAWVLIDSLDAGSA
ncbi:cysteine proteinase [Dothidotthia symphoricarpi CBS 119687]|uniref:Cysteine proteinase n=1 Tax=Dothidotthia symphoricarpi CBS 119687 TaxID=1392245 RepID=A0A6A6AKG1_9PLEO|nr:cysteine proteinase [Dothidotthia symphoricarpi CBS 119687]KAF2131723.1 cysteine proteinase [Dothidotthia symphoricarpi CBS 119687]